MSEYEFLQGERQLLPDLDTEYGTYKSGVFAYDPSLRNTRQLAPNQIRGRHEYAMQPYDASRGAMYAADPAPTAAPAAPVDMAKMIIIVVIASVLAYMLGKSAGKKSRVNTNPCHGAHHNPCPHCGAACAEPAYHSPAKTRARRKLRAIARQRPRDENGRFI